MKAFFPDFEDFLIVLKLLIFKKYTPVSWIPQLVEGSIQYELYYTTKCKNCVIQCATGKEAFQP